MHQSCTDPYSFIQPPGCIYTSHSTSVPSSVDHHICLVVTSVYYQQMYAGIVPMPHPTFLDKVFLVSQRWCDSNGTLYYYSHLFHLILDQYFFFLVSTSHSPTSEPSVWMNICSHGLKSRSHRPNNNLSTILVFPWVLSYQPVSLIHHSSVNNIPLAATRGSKNTPDTTPQCRWQPSICISMECTFPALSRCYKLHQAPWLDQLTVPKVYAICL